MSEIPKAFNPAEAESKWYAYWEDNHYFSASVKKEKDHYTIVIPPPNITGILTMGHVLNNTLQDVFIRWKRMEGFETLWMPGTDHAGIATQNVVEKSLAKEGKTRHDLGRDKFVERVWGWREEYGRTIIKQLKKLGTSCDWARERFTMDEGLSDAVQEIFVRLHKKGLIYRGKYIINWCPKDHTAISDDEVNHTEQNGSLWHIKYPVAGSDEFVTVATTRPETMLGDTAVAVHPEDRRFKALVGKKVLLPLAMREIPVIADDVVDPKFGTGVVKVTPAHDPNDYWIAQRHNERAAASDKMEFINIFDISAKTNEHVPAKYRGLDRYEARKIVLKDLESSGLLIKTEPYTNNIGRCYRCDTVIEPYLSDQWFVKMRPLAEPALRAVTEGHIHFHPERWTKTYEHWMNGIRDWCISRQLWWGHRIPVWYCAGPQPGNQGCQEPIVSRSAPAACPSCGSANLRQDEDVLDTWFSSWLWPFSTLGWPEDNQELRYFYPTDTLVTAPDIIFFWVARMVMAGIEVMGEIPKIDGTPRESLEDKIPFRDVYFTSLIRDMQGRKMSKSLGNSPDPLDVISEYGADALRFTVLYLAPLGQDVLYSNEKCEIGRNFANKIWNAGRFLLMNKEQLSQSVGALKAEGTGIPEGDLDLADRWILSRLHSTIEELTAALNSFDINIATKILYDFLWHDYCDWYVEMIKGRLYGSETDQVKSVVLERAISIYEQALRLLHPFMPFVTEELWHHLARRQAGASIMVSPFPKADRRWINRETEDEMQYVQNAVNGIRNIRGELSVPPSKEITLILNFTDKSKAGIIVKYQKYFERLARVVKIESLGPQGKPRLAASAVLPGGEIFIPLEGIIDIGSERERIGKELRHVENMIQTVEKKLSNRSFVDKAPQEVVDKERAKLHNFKESESKLRNNLNQL